MATNFKKQSQSLKIPRIIVITGKFLAFISTKLAVLFAVKLFTSPLKYGIPKRELEMDKKSRQYKIHIPTISKEIVVYHFGDGVHKILLVHGWSGRGTQLVKLAEALVAYGYSTISFDAPAHGKSAGKTTLLPEFIETILALENKFGPFTAAIGHSLGGIALLNAVKRDLKIKSLVIIGSADIVSDIVEDFVKKLELNHKIANLLCTHFEKKSNVSMDSFSASRIAKVIEIPVLIIHDQNDCEVPFECSINIHANLKNSELLLTKDLGHRKILGDHNVIAKVLDFINSKITADA